MSSPSKSNNSTQKYLTVSCEDSAAYGIPSQVNEGASLPVKPEVLNELRMTQSSLTNVFPVPQNSLSHRCLGVIRDQTRGFIIIGYNLVLQNDINWERARTNFQSFLARHFHTAHVNIDVIGVAWNASHCWYIMRENEIKMVSKPTTLETLPDEVLLEVCEYLLNVDILYSFFDLNSRMRRMISQYYDSISLHKASIVQSSYLCQTVLPQIGSCIQSLVVDRCYSVMQHELFIKHFSERMSRVFPSLKRISLVGFQYSHLVAFLDSLHDFKHLEEIHLHDLFGINEEHQADALRALLQANNNHLTSILVNTESSFLQFYHTDCYANIRRLRLTLKGIKDLAAFFVVVPNIQYLDVTLIEEDMENVPTDELKIDSLNHLVDFQLRSTKRWWNGEELQFMLLHLPNVKFLALFICVFDEKLVYGNEILSLLPPRVQHFHYAIFYPPNMVFDHNNCIIKSWPTSYPIVCHYSDDFGFLHTLPWHFKCITFPTSIGKEMCKPTKCKTGYDTGVKRLEVALDESLTLNDSLGMIAQCRRLKHLIIFVNATSEASKEEKQNESISLPVFLQLTQIFIYASNIIGFEQFSSIFFSAPNLIRLDLPCDYLLNLLEKQPMRDLLGQRIKSLVVLDATRASSVKLTEENVHLIAMTFTNLCDVYVDVTHLTSTSNEIVPSSMESMVIRLLSEFMPRKLISLVVDIQPSEEIKTNSKQWLYENTILRHQLFDADFNKELNRLIIWM
ncbi:unnamed protein product [Adineta ricciae]|uniref:F-box domain-containing protein n=2 Tax=Adineta ricciae TaxID=249248 RepID=A0A814RNV4_ADIRI|nr:unnamed protein product [Adineta ricciae]